MLYDAYEVQRSLLAGASKLAGLGAGWLNNPANPVGLQLDGAAGRGEPRGLRPRLRAARQARIRDPQRQGRPQAGARSTRRSCCASRSASSSISRAKAIDSGPRAADRRADVGPLCDAAARNGRAAAAELRRLHHRLARREAGAAVGGQLRPRRLCRLSDRVPRAYRRDDRRAAAPARGVPAGGAGLRRDRADERRQESVAAEDPDHDGRADRHAQGADRGQHAGDAAAVRLVREQCHRDRADDLPGRGAEGLSGLPPARRIHDHEPRLAPHQPLGDVQASRRRRRRGRGGDAEILRRISLGLRHDRGILPADGRRRVPAASAAARAR